MARRLPRVTLVHNEAAGDSHHDRAALFELITVAGYRVVAVSAKQSDLAAVLGEPADLVVAAGGDGTVRRVVTAAAGATTPIAILPLGTANNIARSLGLTAPLPELIAGWGSGRLLPFHPIAADGPWGRRRLVEGIGFGALAQAIDELQDERPDTIEARERIAATILETPSECLDIHADGQSGITEFALCEITTIALVGPRLCLAPGANPADRRLEICLLGAAAEERRRFAAWLRQGDAAGPAPLAVCSARRISIAGRVGSVRLDDEAWSNPAGLAVTLTLAAEPEPLRFLVSGQGAPDRKEGAASAHACGR